MAQRFLLIEDDREVAKIVLEGLSMQGLEGDWETDGLKGYYSFLAHKYDLIITDVNLPSLSGLELLKRFRNVKSEVPVILLTGISGIEDRAQGLVAGAEDYICKPFSIAELQIRVKNIMKGQDRLSTISYGDLKLDRIRRTLSRGGQKFEIQEREFMLLDLLFSNPDKIISKDQIIRDICGYNFMPNTNIVDVLVCRLRDKISNEQSMVSIRTVRGVGYKIHLEHQQTAKAPVSHQGLSIPLM